MKYKFFVIPASSPQAAEAELNAFCSRHRVGFVEKQLISDGANSFWSVCVSWLDGEAAPSTNDRKKPPVDYKKVLSEVDFTLYLELRNLRKEVAQFSGVPAYAVFTNEQLAAMVQQRISSKNALLALPGIGKSRVEKYGEEFLQKLSELLSCSSSGDGDEANPDKS